MRPPSAAAVELGRPLHRLRVGEVELLRMRRPRRRERLLVGVPHRDPRALGGQASRHGLPDAGDAAGDDAAAAREASARQGLAHGATRTPFQNATRSLISAAAGFGSA